uniref:Uncharacterized protein n=1 Tax=Salmonella phage vB_SEnST11_KE24 TaxID=3161175 RepID=A0AAU8GJM4_9CAUD
MASINKNKGGNKGIQVPDKGGIYLFIIYYYYYILLIILEVIKTAT